MRRDPEHDKAVQAMRDCQLAMALEDGELFVIALLDVWLEEWLWYIEQCPNCGTKEHE